MFFRGMTKTMIRRKFSGMRERSYIMQLLPSARYNSFLGKRRLLHELPTLECNKVFLIHEENFVGEQNVSILSIR